MLTVILISIFTDHHRLISFVVLRCLLDLKLSDDDGMTVSAQGPGSIADDSTVEDKDYLAKKYQSIQRKYHALQVNHTHFINQEIFDHSPLFLQL